MSPSTIPFIIKYNIRIYFILLHTYQPFSEFLKNRKSIISRPTNMLLSINVISYDPSYYVVRGSDNPILKVGLAQTNLYSDVDELLPIEKK